MLSTSQHASLEARSRRLPSQGRAATPPRKSGFFRKNIERHFSVFLQVVFRFGVGL